MKKAIAIILMCTMAAAVFAGCSNSGSSSSSSAGSEASSSSASSSTVSAAASSAASSTTSSITSGDNAVDSDFTYMSDGADGTEITKYNGNAESVTIPEKLGEKKVTTLSSNAFANNTSIKKVVFPSTMVTLKDSVFLNCSALTDVTLNDGLQTIGQQ